MLSGLPDNPRKALRREADDSYRGCSGSDLKNGRDNEMTGCGSCRMHIILERVEKSGSPYNGNYMMALELVAEFDPFLASHIARYGNEGRGNVSYLSSYTCNEFITLMASNVISNIIKEVKEAKYFSISIDSTPDISHVDQLAFILRYVNNDGIPVEKFLCFLPNTGHKSEQLADAVLSTLNCYGLNIANCHGQLYNNATNTSGVYSGLQARIKNINPYAVYVPFSAHSLNLVGVCAAESCQEACSFFSTVQHLYSFFSASTHQWEILLSNLKPGSKAIKRLSETRWSSRVEACHNLSENWNAIIKALNTIKEDATEKPVTHNEAAGLQRKLDRLEAAFMAVFWSSLLERFHITSQKLQNVYIDIQTVVELYNSLIGYINSIQDLFDMYEEKAKEKSEIEDYDFDTKRKRKRKLQAEETREVEVEMCGRDKFKVDTFLLDLVCSELKRRSNAYQEIYGSFQFLSNITNTSTADITVHAKKLRLCYQGDLEESFVNECLHFRSYLEGVEIPENEKKSIIRYCSLLRNRNIHSVYPNLDIAFRMFVCTPATNCSVERSFSALKRVENYLRANLSEEKLNSLSLLTIEKDLTTSLDYTELINKFAAQSVGGHLWSINLEMFADEEHLKLSKNREIISCLVHEESYEEHLLDQNLNEKVMD
ncbi:zinc finger MYM-type protein 1-like [Terrapene carolina triunguis]|uniref:zinc finger MYM-type protein 1-like n=1 Tax=Terrapene triunguis TaxID=2587831 RepID=UPI001156840B|nr:zinc finger MYM-type protein 1-like [Terrapene carolina triunguis]